VLANRNRKDSEELENFGEEEDNLRFDNLDEREDIEGQDEEDEETDYGKSRTSMRETLQAYDPNRAAEDHENEFVAENVEVDKDEDKLFSGLGRRDDDSDSDEDQPIGEAKIEEEDNVSESSDYYDNSYWQINQYTIEDLLNA